MHNALNSIVAARRARPKESHVKIDARTVDEMLKSTHKLIDELNAEKNRVRELEAKLEQIISG